MVINKDDMPLLGKILGHYGIEAQVRQCMEECAELIQALNKYHRRRCDKTTVVEEIADVMIMCEQMAVIFGYNDVACALADKIQRTKQRIENHGTTNNEI